MKKYLITGGAGFLGRPIAELLANKGNKVVVFDNQSRTTSVGSTFDSKNITFIKGDIRDKKTVKKTCEGIHTVIHMAFVNGTDFFYKIPEVVLEVGVKGITNILDASIDAGVQEFFLASSSEVYFNPNLIPTPEDIPLIIPDPYNPRYSYSAGKVISEVMTIHYGKKHFKRTVIFRPHNVYGPAMGREHVIPQILLRIKTLEKKKGNIIKLPIQGDGSQTRSFIYIDDFTRALMMLLKHAKNLETYNIGTSEEISIKTLCEIIGDTNGKKISIVKSKPISGSPSRRCPDVRKIKGIGFSPKISLQEGIKKTALWYNSNL